MTIKDLRSIIRKYDAPEGGWYYVKGCKLLEHIEDVPGFISLLRGFKARAMSRCFNDMYSDPIGVIIHGDFIFGISIHDVVVVHDRLNHLSYEFVEGK